MPISVLIADSHCMLIAGLSQLFEESSLCPRVAGVQTCEDLMKQLRKGNPTHLIYDFELQDGNIMQILPNIVVLYPNLQMMVYSGRLLTSYRSVYHKYNIRYCLPKNASVTLAIRYFKRFFATEPASDVFAIRDEAYAANPLSRLTPRHLEILHHFISGLKDSEIAVNSAVSPSTIAVTKRNIMSKLKIDDWGQVMAFACPYLEDKPQVRVDLLSDFESSKKRPKRRMDRGKVDKLLLSPETWDIGDDEILSELEYSFGAAIYSDISKSGIVTNAFLSQFIKNAVVGGKRHSFWNLSYKNTWVFLCHLWLCQDPNNPCEILRNIWAKTGDCVLSLHRKVNPNRHEIFAAYYFSIKRASLCLGAETLVLRLHPLADKPYVQVACCIGAVIRDSDPPDADGYRLYTIGISNFAQKNNHYFDSLSAGVLDQVG